MKRHPAALERHRAGNKGCKWLETHSGGLRSHVKRIRLSEPWYDNGRGSAQNFLLVYELRLDLNRRGMIRVFPTGQVAVG
ncbi:MAG: hypothetical protein ACLFPA_11955, partial [Dichotomicrobium sp.]